MVRTFLCHPFINPKAFCDNFEPTASCFMRNDCMAISSSQGNIQIYNLKDQDHTLLFAFPTTGGIPVDLDYDDEKEFLVALETRVYDYKPLKSHWDLNCQVYVYWNLRQYSKQKSPTCLMTAEYTRNIRGSAISSYVSKTPVIDIGVHEPVTDVDICKQNHNIALSARNKVYVFTFKEVFDETPGGASEAGMDAEPVSGRLIDFFKVIEVDTSFHVRTLAMANNYLAFASRHEIRVIQFMVVWPQDERQLSRIVSKNDGETIQTHVSSKAGTKALEMESIGLSNGSNPLTYDENFVAWTFNDLDADLLNSTTPGSELFLSNGGGGVIKFDAVKKEPPYADGSLTSKEVIGPVDDMVGHPFAISLVEEFINSLVKNNNNSNQKSSEGSIRAVTWLYRRFESNEMSTSDTIDSLHSLQWLPVFVQDSMSDEPAEKSATSWPENVFHLPPSSKCHLSLFFSTGVYGYLYNINGSAVKKIVTYHYTSDCSMAVHTESFLYAVTKSGLEAYTSRLYASVAERCRALCDNNEDTMERTESLTQYTGYCYDPLQNSEKFFESYSPVSSSGLREAHPGLPRYSQQALTLPCPPSSLDCCLIGLFAVHNIQFVGASSSYIGMLIKAREKNDRHNENNISPWSMYSLSKTPICDFYNELMALIDGNENSNPTVYHQLLCEGNLMLRSELKIGSTMRQQMEFHLRLSASKIAEFLSRCDDTFDFSNICAYYSMAGITFKDAVLAFVEYQRSAAAKKSTEVVESPKFAGVRSGGGMLLYLDSVLFAQHDIDVDKELSDSILKIYYDLQPSMLSRVVLDSNVKSFSGDVAIKYLNKHRKASESKSMMVDPLDYLGLAVLHMNVGNPNKAENLLGEIDAASLLKMLEGRLSLLLNDLYRVTPFGQLLKKHFKSSFVSIMVWMLDQGKVTLHNILDAFVEDERDGEVFYSYTVCEVLERILNDNIYKKHFSKTSTFLFDQYLHHIGKNSSTINAKSTHQHIPKGNGHFAARFSWLNSMDPFTGEPTASEECKASCSTPTLLGRSKLDSKSHCSCCCCNEVLLKMQSLLCSRHNRKELSVHVIEKLTNSSFEFVGRESVLLLCWAKADNSEESVECMVRKYPNICLQYARDIFDWKAQWQLLLQFVLSVMKNGEYDQWNYESYLSLLRGVLLRLVRAYTPAEFLTFLPDNGMASFFLPYLHECWEYHKSSGLKQRFLDQHKISEET